MILGKISRVHNLRSIPNLVSVLHRFSSAAYGFKRLSKDEIDNCIRESLDKFDDVEFAPYRIKTFVLGTSFNSAHVDFVQYSEDVDGNYVDLDEEKRRRQLFTPKIAFSSIFENGFKALGGECGGSGWNSRIKIVTDVLKYGFIPDKDFHEMCLRKVRYVPNQSSEELYITTILTNHLLSKLTTVGGYLCFIANDYANKPNFQICPCRYCDDEILFGNTGIGSEFLWYGRPDIMLYTLGGGNFNVVCPSDEDDITDLSDLMIEMESPDISVVEGKSKSAALRYRKNMTQFISQVITFSFYQAALQKKQKRTTSSRCTLIPTLAISGSHFDIYIYDSENDILLRNYGKPIPLWNEISSESTYVTLNMSSVLMLWMVLNHMTLKPSLSQEDMHKVRGTCNFLPHIPNERKLLIENTMARKKRFYPLRKGEERELLSLPKTKKIGEGIQEFLDESKLPDK